MLYLSFILPLLASAVVAQLSDSNLKTHVGSLTLSSSFNPIKESYWTGLPHHRRTPFAVSPDGKSAYLAYLDASQTGVHIQQVDPSTFAAVGTAITIAGGKEAGGLVAHNDGFALLTNEAMPSGTANAPPSSTPVAVLYRYTAGKQTFKTWLGGPDLKGDMGSLASPDLNGDLAYSETAKTYGAYFVVTAYSGFAEGHFGDAIQYVNAAGAVQQIQGASSSWGCSHNTGIAFEGADAVPFPSICSEDQGAIWLNTGGTGMENIGVKISNENVQNGAGNEAMGGMSGSYSGLARFVGSSSYIFSWVSRGAKDLTTNDWMGPGYTHSVNRTVNRNVAIATFSDKKTLVGPQATSQLVADGDSQVNWITTGSADCQNAHVAAFDGTNAIVTWEEIAAPTCEFIAMGCKGAYTGSYFQLVNNGKKVGAPLKSTNVYVAGDMVTFADGRVCWPYVDMKWTLDGPVRNPASVNAISFACASLNGTATGDSITPPASSAPASLRTSVGTSAPASVRTSASAAIRTSAAASVRTSAPVSVRTSITSRTSAIKSATPVRSSSAVKKPVRVSRNADTTGIPIFIDTTAVPMPTPAPQAPADSALPTFELVTSGATITPPTTSAAVAESTTLPADDDQPAPYESVPVPASESFNPTGAPVFTPAPDTPDASAAPEYSSTPLAEVTPTETPEYPEYPTASVSGDVLSTALPIETPAGEEGEPEVSSAIAISTELPPYPTGTGAPVFPPFPTGTGRPGHHHGGHHGHHRIRPRPTGFWPTRGYPHPTGYYALGHGKAKNTPRTLQTRVRPTPTAAALMRA